MPTDYRTLYSKDYIGAWDLEQGDMVITISSVKGGELTSPGGRKSKKPVVMFEGSKKGFALNATNGKTIATMYGKYVEKWVGKKLALYKAMARNPEGGPDVECIRVRPTAPTGNATAPATEPDAAEPAASTDYITPDQALALEARCRELGCIDAFKATAKVSMFAQVLVSDYEDACKWIDKRAKRATEAAT